MERTRNIPLKISDLFNRAKREKWVVEYDSDLDSLYWTKPKISKNTKLKKFLDDFSLYITSSGQVEGIFIEYAKYNFLSHNKKYEPIFNVMKSSGGEKYILRRKDEKSVESLLESMAEKVGTETLGAIERGLDLNKVIKA